MAEDNEIKMDEKDAEYPIIPLRDVVIFPSMATAILVGRQPSVNAVEKAIESDKLLLVITQKDPVVDEPEYDDLYTVGTIVRIGVFFRLPDGTIKVMLEGVSRVSVDEYLERENHTSARVSRILEVEKDNKQLEALHRKVEGLFTDYVKMNQRVPNEVLFAVKSIDEPSAFADSIAAHLIVKNDVKQKLLETGLVNERMFTLIGILTKELEILKLEKGIDDEVTERVQKSQKELFLHEKMRVIKDELGHSDKYSENDEIEEKIKEAEMSREAEKIVFKELNRLKMMSPMSPEATVVRNYIDTMTSLPWNKQTEDALNIQKVKERLDADHYGLKKVKERVLEFLSVVKLTTEVKGTILCFVGPPGVGKTSLGKSIANAIGRKFVRFSLGGIRDEAEIRGHRRTYIGSRPGRIIQMLKKAGSKNPVIMLDEIDKLSADFRGDPASALLEVLDPEQNRNFIDNYLEVDFDVGKVMFITTANVLHTIPPALRDRMEIIRLPGYLQYEKIEIAKRFLMKKQMLEHGIKRKQLNITPATLRDIIQFYTRESGVRELERKIAEICRKVARKIAEAEDDFDGTVRITKKNLPDYLGIPSYQESEIDQKMTVGMATGLAWTQSGGEILNIEVTLMPGKGELILTGQLGDIMKESARIALSYARNKARLLNLDNDFFSSVDLHVHVPEGAIPKDGPSAGISMATAMISSFFDIPVRRDVAMTGEMTLRGKVLPVGGIKEKSVAALRAGVKTLLLPKANKKNIKELPKQVKDNIKITVVDSMDEVLPHVLTKKLSWGIKRRHRTGGLFKRQPSQSAN
ncbi:MAG: endopeptidase La [Candidatus Krumholzibacteriota bacterium]|nr:endopeptidase La [Candidatus Krumholzibacteriota bacterium]